MSYTSKLVVAALLASGRAGAQGIVTERNVSLGLAKTIAEAALAECSARGFHTSVAVVDRSGQLLVMLRDEQAPPTTLEMARRKAYTARMFRISTAEFQKRTTPDQPQARNATSPICWRSPAEFRF